MHRVGAAGEVPRFTGSCGGLPAPNPRAARLQFVQQVGGAKEQRHLGKELEVQEGDVHAILCIRKYARAHVCANRQPKTRPALQDDLQPCSTCAVLHATVMPTHAVLVVLTQAPFEPGGQALETALCPPRNEQPRGCRRPPSPLCGQTCEVAEQALRGSLWLPLPVHCRWQAAQ